MHIVLWDTRQRDVSKDFAGGFGVGQYPGKGFRGRIVRHFYKRDRRPVAMVFAYLTAILRRLGHTVEYSEDVVPAEGDVYILNPSLITLDLERGAIRRINELNPSARVLVVGLVAHTLREAFDGLDCTVVAGEVERLMERFDDVLESVEKVVEIGSFDDLDQLPFPDWDLFGPKRFRIGYDFTRFPTGLVQASRGCTFKCNYCPYIIVRNKVRFRPVESVLDEIQRGMRLYGFRSFKFRDPLFGLDRRRALEIAEGIASLSKRIQFSVESRIDLMRDETLEALREAGLTAITIGIETPDNATLKRYERAPIRDDRQFEFVARCRALGVRTVAGFMIGFPEDTRRSIRDVLKYAKRLNPTFANFNICTPYPGTGFTEQIRGQVADFDWTKYNVYTPVLKYEHLTPEEVAELHAKCFESYYFRGSYLAQNATLLWPWLRLLGVRPARSISVPDEGDDAPQSAAAPMPVDARADSSHPSPSPHPTEKSALPIVDRD
jgi:radical SAM superfamily enzyme YgiQ (UPF0313 family)